VTGPNLEAAITLATNREIPAKLLEIRIEPGSLNEKMYDLYQDYISDFVKDDDYEGAAQAEEGYLSPDKDFLEQLLEECPEAILQVDLIVETKKGRCFAALRRAGAKITPPHPDAVEAVDEAHTTLYNAGIFAEPFNPQDYFKKLQDDARKRLDEALQGLRRALQAYIEAEVQARTYPLRRNPE